MYIQNNTNTIFNVVFVVFILTFYNCNRLQNKNIKSIEEIKKKEFGSLIKLEDLPIDLIGKVCEFLNTKSFSKFLCVDTFVNKSLQKRRDLWKNRIYAPEFYSLYLIEDFYIDCRYFNTNAHILKLYFDQYKGNLTQIDYQDTSEEPYDGTKRNKEERRKFNKNHCHHIKNCVKKKIAPKEILISEIFKFPLGDVLCDCFSLENLEHLKFHYNWGTALWDTQLDKNIVPKLKKLSFNSMDMSRVLSTLDFIDFEIIQQLKLEEIKMDITTSNCFDGKFKNLKILYINLRQNYENDRQIIGDLIGILSEIDLYKLKKLTINLILENINKKKKRNINVLAKIF